MRFRLAVVVVAVAAGVPPLKLDPPTTEILRRICVGPTSSNSSSAEESGSGAGTGKTVVGFLAEAGGGPMSSFVELRRWWREAAGADLGVLNLFAGATFDFVGVFLVASEARVFRLATLDD